MGKTTALVGLSYPSERQSRWYEDFEAGIKALDVIAYAVREDRNLLVLSGAAFQWAETTFTLSWDADLLVLNLRAGRTFTIAAGSVVLDDDGDLAYVSLVRNPSANATLTPTVTTTIPNDDSAFLVAVRKDVGGEPTVWLRGGHPLRKRASATSSVTDFRRPYLGAREASMVIFDEFVLAGQTVVAGDVVESGLTGGVRQAQANSTTVLGVALTGGAAGAHVFVQCGGLARLVVENGQSLAGGVRVKIGAMVNQVRSAGAGSLVGTLGIALRNATGDGSASAAILLSPMGG